MTALSAPGEQPVEPYSARLAWAFRIPRRRDLAGLLDGNGFKRVLDVTLVLLSLPLWGPLLAAVAAIVKLSEPTAPVLFTQNRCGMHGRPFRILKLRTMVPDAERLKAQLAALNERPGLSFKITNDPRVTPLGRFLRKTRLDELPQLINVLRGDMALVGPRPIGVEARRHALWQTRKLDVRPGLTCLWQLVQREYPSFDDQQRLDIAYVDRRCLKLDLLILAHTFAELVRGGRGA